MKTLLLFVLFPLMAIGQKKAFWETKLFFEDGIGNKDSITIGHDIEANWDFNPDFGEINIKDLPWDSVFEVRASHNVGANGHASPKVLSKKIIGSTEGGFHPTHNCLFVRQSLKFFVKVKHFPLKISWNNEDHNDFCNRQNYMTPHITPQADPYWFLDTTQYSSNDYVCLFENSEYILEDLSKYKFFDFVLEENSQGSFDTIHGFFISFKTQTSQFSPCSGTVDVIDLVLREVDVKLFPNPSSDLINLESSHHLNWELYDVQGRLLKMGQDLIIDIQDFDNGLYFLKIKINDIIVTKKFVKSG